MKKLIRYLWIFIFLLHKTKAHHEGCDHSIELTEETGKIYVNSPNYPNRYPLGSSCRYELKAPLDYGIYLECRVDIQNFGHNCTSEYLYVSVAGDHTLNSSHAFCGRATIKIQSTGNQLSLGYIASSHGHGHGHGHSGGSFSCKVEISSKCDCGWPYSPYGYIQVTKFPFMVAIEFRKIYICSGTIISNRFVLTAARYIKGKESNMLEVRVGEQGVISTPKLSYTATYSIDYVKIHESYVSHHNGANDIALLRTSHNILFSAVVGPVCLPFMHPNNVFRGKLADMIGWGTKLQGTLLRFSPALLQSTIRVQDNGLCKAMHNTKILDSQICNLGYGKDDCQNDVGGPIIYNNSRIFLIGIVSYGKFCPKSAAPGVHTRISFYLKWIQNNTRANFCRMPFET